MICEDTVFDVVSQSLNEVKLNETALYTFGNQLKGNAKSVNELLEGYEEKSKGFRQPIYNDLTKDLAFLMCSSGTTGLPKVVSIPHALLLQDVSKMP